MKIGEITLWTAVIGCINFRPFWLCSLATVDLKLVTFPKMKYTCCKIENLQLYPTVWSPEAVFGGHLLWKSLILRFTGPWRPKNALILLFICLWRHRRHFRSNWRAYRGCGGQFRGQKCLGGQHFSLFWPYMVRNAEMAHDFKKVKKKTIIRLEKISFFVFWSIVLSSK